MKLYNSIGPNPRAVRMFAAEKQIEIPRIEVDLIGGENRREPYLRKNPMGQLPALELETGECITEIVAICEYLEDTHPSPPLIGSTPEEKAESRKWTRCVDLNICEPMANGFRFCEGLALFQNRIVTVPEAADGLKRIAQDRIGWLDAHMGGKEFVCGPRFTLADILLFCFLDFGRQVGQPLREENKNIAAWFQRVKSRPAARA
ncbi:MAG: glutathione S-transferase family protein [Alphaproteobacteria bacterium]|nr:glutathione S-transferase family protein [Alphaproteobacteria bacterium]MBV9063733.1 glutathione S-transferase family protein [Alphaproteobacteria bacterium]